MSRPFWPCNAPDLARTGGRDWVSTYTLARPDERLVPTIVQYLALQLVGIRDFVEERFEVTGRRVLAALRQVGRIVDSPQQVGPLFQHVVCRVGHFGVELAQAAIIPDTHRSD